MTLRWNSFPSLFLWGPNVGYVVEGGLNPGEVLASVKTGSTLPVLTFVAPTGAFYVRVHVLVGNLKTAPSNEIRIFVNVPAAPSPPDRLLSHVDGTDLTLAWRNIQNGGQATALLIDVSGWFGGTFAVPVADTLSFSGMPAECLTP